MDITVSKNITDFYEAAYEWLHKQMRRCFYVIKFGWMHVVSTGNILYGPLLARLRSIQNTRLKLTYNIRSTDVLIKYERSFEKSPWCSYKKND